MPTLKKSDNDMWLTPPHTATKMSKKHKDAEAQDDLLAYKKNLKLAIVNSLSKHNRPC